MTKLFTFFITALICQNVFSQTAYPSLNINLLSTINPEVTYANPQSWLQKYSGCWGWYQANKNKEYAIIGSASGAYFIDVSSPTNPILLDSVKVNNFAIHREVKTYSHYAYITTDEAGGRTCLVDLQYLPDSVHEISPSVHHLPNNSHTLFIENNKLYLDNVVMSAGTATLTGPSGLAVYDLTNPTTPSLLRYIEQDYTTGSPLGCYAHDVFVNNDTIFASCANAGLKVYLFTAANTFSLLATYSNYIHAGYNHSSWMTEDKKHLIFCDEVPTGLTAKMIDIQDFSNIQLSDTFRSHIGATAHNPYIVGNRWCWMSTYEDGIYLYDLSNPFNVSIHGYFDTRPAHGFNDNYPDAYSGNWGAYPYLPSKIILALDMQNGLFILDGDTAYKSSVVTTKKEIKQYSYDISIFPNPIENELNLHINTLSENKLIYVLIDALGRTVLTGSTNNRKTTINTSDLEKGMYSLTITNEHRIALKTIKLVK